MPDTTSPVAPATPLEQRTDSDLVTAIREHLESQGWTGTIHVATESTATCALAAEQLGVEVGRIAKSVSFYDPENPKHALIVLAPGDVKVHGGQFKRTLGAKPRMLKGEDVERLTGYPAGAVSPFLNPSGTRILLDRSLQRFESVFPAAGTKTSSADIPVADLEQLTKAEAWVDVCVPIDSGT